MKRAIAWTYVALALAACDAGPFAPTVDGRFVVQAYLYAGEPVTDVRVTSTLPLGAPDSIAPPIDHAEVALIRAGQRYPLVPTPGRDGYYHYPGSDLEVSAADVFDLEVTVDGIMATGRTVVPPPPDGVTLSATELRVQGYWALEPLVVRWQNPGQAWHFITHRNVEADPRPIFEGTIIIRPGLLVSEPIAADSAAISPYALTHYGQYEVSVYRVNDEYERLYMSLHQDTRDLNEPASNIDNGLGIFTAFNRRAAFFRLSAD